MTALVNAIIVGIAIGLTAMHAPDLGAAVNNLLLEDGSNLLLEDGSVLELE